MSEWYYLRQGQQFGPVSSAGLKTLARSGEIEPTDLVWKDGLENWLAASAIPSLFPASANPQSARSGREAATGTPAGDRKHVLRPPPRPTSSEDVGAANWFYARNGQQFGPVSRPELQRLAASGSLQPTDAVWSEGFSEWVRADSVPALFAVTSAGVSGQEGIAPVGIVALHVKRVFALGSQQFALSAREESLLTSRGLASDGVARLLCWRFSLLAVAIFPAVLSAILATIDIAEDDFANLSGFGSFVAGAGIVAAYSLPISAAVALFAWTDFRLSHRVLLSGWAIGFLLPIALALFPFEWLIAERVRESRSALLSSQDMQLLLALVGGLGYYLSLMPVVLSQFPGLLRAALRLLPFVPGSVLPGGIVLVAAPLFSLLLMVVFVSVNQIAGNVLLFLGAALLVAAPAVLVSRPRLLLRPSTIESRQLLSQLQLIAVGVATLGVTLIVIYCFTKKLFDRRLVGFDAEESLVRPWRLLQFYFDYIGRSLFITVVSADLMIKAVASSWRGAKDFRDTSDTRLHEDRMAQIEQVLSRK